MRMVGVLIFDPELASHRHVETSFCGEHFDSSTQAALSYIGGMAGYVYSKPTYRWKGLSLVPIYVEIQDYDSVRDLFVRTSVEIDDNPWGPKVSTIVLTPAEVWRSLKN